MLSASPSSVVDGVNYVRNVFVFKVENLMGISKYWLLVNAQLNVTSYKQILHTQKEHIRKKLPPRNVIMGDVYLFKHCFLYWW